MLLIFICRFLICIHYFGMCRWYRTSRMWYNFTCSIGVLQMQRPKEAYIEYKNNPTKEKEVEIINEALSDASKDAPIFWKYAFESAPEVYLSLTLAYRNQIIEDTFNDVKMSTGDAQDSILRLACSTALGLDDSWRELCFSAGLESRFEEHINMWIERFVEYPEFTQHLTKRLLQNKLPDCNREVEADVSKETYTFDVPFQIYVDGHKSCIFSDTSINTYILDMLKRQPITLCQFICDSFIDESFYIDASELSSNVLTLLITFKSTDVLSAGNLKEIEDKLDGQLKDGWGENLQQKARLINGKDISISFGKPIFHNICLQTYDLK